MADVTPRTLYHFTDEPSVQGIKQHGFVNDLGVTSFYVTWPSDDLAPQGRSDCTWYVIVDIPSDLLEPDLLNPDLVCAVPNEVVNVYHDGFRYERVSPGQRHAWGFS